MTTISYSAVRADLAKTITQVCRDHIPVIIKKKKDSVVMMSLDDYQAWAETIYLLRSPKNADRLVKSISSLEKGDAVAKSLESLLDGQS